MAVDGVHPLIDELVTGVPPTVLFVVLQYHWYDRLPPSVLFASTNKLMGVSFCT